MDSNKLQLFPYYEGHIWIYPEKRIGQEVARKGVYEPVIIEIIRCFSEATFSFVDVGANVGLHTLAAAFRKGDSKQRFIAFEPEKEVFSILQKNCMLNQLGFVECYAQGVANINGELTLNVSITEKEGDHSFLRREGTKPGYNVCVTTLDTFFLQENCLFDRPILVKVDVEGYEILVIQGGIQWLSQLTDVVLICEISPYLLSIYDKTGDDVIDLVQQAGFTSGFMIKDPETFTEQGARKKKYVNALFLKGELSKEVFNNMNHDTFICMSEVALN